MTCRFKHTLSSSWMLLFGACPPSLPGNSTCVSHSSFQNKVASRLYASSLQEEKKKAILRNWYYLLIFPLTVKSENYVRSPPFGRSEKLWETRRRCKSMTTASRSFIAMARGLQAQTQARRRGWGAGGRGQVPLKCWVEVSKTLITSASVSQPR